MALLQISEPGQSPRPHQKVVPIGIDLGTTHSLVAAQKSGEMLCLPDDHGRSLLASMIAYGPENLAVTGLDALDYQHLDGWCFVSSIKRFIGRNSDEVKALCEHHPVSFEWDLSEDALPKVKTPHGFKTPVEISADLLKTLKQRVVQHFGIDPINASDAKAFPTVITVPAYFDDAQRLATQQAGVLAGLHIVRLINEPTAAALAYGLDADQKQQYIVYDLGGGTFDVTLLKQSEALFEVVSTSGDTFLGGDDIDQKIAELILARYQKNNIRLNWHELRQEARQVKEALSSKEQVYLNPTALNLDEPVIFNRKDLMQSAAPLIERTIKLVEKVLNDAEQGLESIDRIILVGGSTRSPVVQQALAEHFDLPLQFGMNPDEIVALGALKLCQKLQGQDKDQGLLLDVTPLSLGLETMGGIVEKIIPRNTPIPVTKSQEFTTFQQGQTALLVHVLQGERETVDACRSLARFELQGIPSLPAGVARIEVTFSIDENGLLDVKAIEKRTGVASKIQVRPSQGLDEDAITQMLKSSYTHASEDLQQRQVREKVIEAERLLYACEAALEEDKSLLSSEESQSLEATMLALKTCLHTTPIHEENLHAATQSLQTTSETLAQRRMDKAIQAALGGTSITEF